MKPSNGDGAKHLNGIIDKTIVEIRRTTNETHNKFKTLIPDKTTAKNRLEETLKEANKDGSKKLN